MMIRSVRCVAAAVLLASGGTSAWAQRPVILSAPVITSTEPTPAGLPAAPAPSFSGPTIAEEIPFPTAPVSSSMPVPMIAPTPAASFVPGPSAPQAACCGATAVVASCCPAPSAPCGAAPVATSCGCAAGGSASFAAFAPAAMYPGGPNAGCCGGGRSGGMGLIDNSGDYGAAGYGPVGYGGAAYGAGAYGAAAPGAYGPTDNVVAFPNGSPNALYSGGYANGGYGAAVSGAWPTHYGDFAGASAVSGFPMGIGSGGTAGEHIRNPYYSDRRPWYSPGPGARTVSIVW